MKLRMLLGWCGICAFLLAATTAAAAPRLINYQGVLTDANGQPVSGTHDLKFSIYADSAQGAATLWTETHFDLELDGGLFNVLLGSAQAIPPGLFGTATRWIGVQLDANAEFRPRSQMTSVAWALRSAVADTALVSVGSDADWTISGTNMYSGVSGNVGIGTTAPGRKVQIGSSSVLNAEGMIRLASRSGTNGSHRIWDVGIPETDAESDGIGYSFIVDDTEFGTDPEFLVKWGTGRVGVGTITPEAQVHVVKARDATAANALKVETITSSGSFTFHNSILVNGTHINGDASLGGDDIHLNYDATGDVSLACGGGNVGIGTSSPTAKLDVVGRAKVTILEITGADLAEKFPVSEETAPGMVVSIDPDTPGQLRLAEGPYDRRVAGVVSGANDFQAGAILGNLPGSEGNAAIALSGRVWVWCDATESAIEPGDLLTTAARAGHAMKATDGARSHGAILGKAMTRLEQGRTGMVLALINLQ